MGAADMYSSQVAVPAKTESFVGFETCQVYACMKCVVLWSVVCIGQVARCCALGGLLTPILNVQQYACV